MIIVAIIILIILITSIAMDPLYQRSNGCAITPGGRPVGGHRPSLPPPVPC